MRCSFLIPLLIFLGLVIFPESKGDIHRAARITSTGEMTASRAAHTSTLLSDGRVLIVGGCTNHGCDPGRDANTAELYDPLTGQFSRIGKMHGDRASEHTATLLSDGNVLIAGGWRNRRPTSSSDLYDPVERRFEKGASMAVRRASHTATRLLDGRVLLIGGYDGSNALASAEIYDPAKGVFEPTGPLQTPRAGHVAIRLLDGRVLVIGGGDTYKDIVLSSAEVYDPASGEFMFTGDLTMIRHKHGAASLPDGRVIVVGGSDTSDFYGRYNSTEIYNPKTGVFTAAALMLSPRFKLPNAVVSLPTGEVLVAGGDDRAELYDPQTESFRQVKGNLDTGRAFSTATLLQDGSVLIAGGYDDRIRLTNRAWLYRE